MIILGWHGSIRREYEDMAPGWAVHDGAAALLRNGEVVAAIEEERLNRIKHSNFFPVRAIRWCLNDAGLSMDDVDCIAMNFAEQDREFSAGDIGRPAPELYIDETERRGPTVRNMLEELFWEEFGVDVSTKLYFCNHHVAHLWSAWGPAVFPDALALSFDGSGDGLSGLVAVGRGGAGLELLRGYDIEHSLGRFYSDLIRFIGYRHFDEYKAMGLAPYGNPDRFSGLFREFYELLPDGEYQLASQADRWANIHDFGIISLARRKGEPFTTMHADFAASLQQTLEAIAMHVISHFRGVTGQRNFCYAGGVAHNCTLNGKIVDSGMFGQVFVQPAAHDAGGALGAALAAEHELSGSPAKISMRNIFTGSKLGTSDEVSRALALWKSLISFERVSDSAAETARLLADGQVVAWVQGRSEFGPRALGHRSILADPRPASNKDRINNMVKKREAFRPFAPAILAERLGDVCDLPQATVDYSHMTYTVRINDKAREELGAVTHVDGTARIQSVSRASNGRFWALISRFEQLTGVPAVLNTSFNNNAEPIIDSVDDAVACFLTTGIDALTVGDFIVRKKRFDDVVRELGCLRPRLANSRKLVQRSRTKADETTAVVYCIEASASKYFVQPSDISESMFHVLLQADGRSTLARLYGACAVSPLCAEELNAEAFALWEARAIVLRP